MKTLIIGGNGKIGKRLVQRCVDAGLDIRVMVRDLGQIEQFVSLGVEAVFGDLEGNISDAISGCEQVVFSAGSGAKSSPHKTLLVDLWGSIRVIEESEKQGIKHFIMVSSLKADAPLRGPERIRHYLVARNLADEKLCTSTLNYTLLRPGRLLDTEATGLVTGKFDWGDSNNAQSCIAREDVVELILQCLSNPDLPAQRRTIDVINGDYPIREFLQDQYSTEMIA
ncbi:SDR family oxidoreductase [Algibacillus agarilyticus]|uniref:SDR family oxidoreductase n=1 Tax=Algibacillus agarilyticus TaxID=2234133 RepID=UPI0013007464|nr:SDR family oxidoreductase [Algibacillus agarilyticus]